MRVIFMGTPDFSVPALQAIAAAHEVVCVYTQPPREAGRGQKPRPSPVQAAAEELGIEIRHPRSLKGAEEQAAFAALNADLAVVVAYGLILPQPVLDAPRLGCLNIHASILPRWRGAAPIHRAIMAGDAETGIAIMQMEAGLDTGPVLAETRTHIDAADTTADLHDRLAEEIDRQIRGLSPFPGAWCEIAGERVKLLRSRRVDGAGRPGEVLDGFRIACGQGAIEVLEAQRAGKRPMPTAEILRGLTLPPRLD